MFYAFAKMKTLNYNGINYQGLKRNHFKENGCFGCLIFPKRGAKLILTFIFQNISFRKVVYWPQDVLISNALNVNDMKEFLVANLGVVISATVLGLFVIFGILYYTTDVVDRIQGFIDDLIE